MDGEFIENESGEEDNLLDSQHNSSENSNSLFPELPSSLSDVENYSYPNNKMTSNKFIEHEQLNNRPLAEGGLCPPSPKSLPRTPIQVTPTQRRSIHENAQHGFTQHGTAQHVNAKHGTDHHESTKHGSAHHQQQFEKPKVNKETDWFWFMFFVLLAGGIVLAAYYAGKLTFWSFATSELQDHQAKPIICTEFNEFNTEFPHQSDKFWAFLKSGVERVANKKPTKPSIFMLLHEPGVDIQLILSKIIGATQKCLGTSKRTPIHLTAATLKKFEYLNDYGRVISDYKSALSDSGIMIVENFSDIPPYVAQAFHTICDGETPYVPRSVIFLTMSVKRISTQDNPFKIAENQLTALWSSSLKDNVLGPLIYRVTDVTLHVNREM